LELWPGEMRRTLQTGPFETTDLRQIQGWIQGVFSLAPHLRGELKILMPPRSENGTP
jgi:hypothetical protein